MLILYRRDGEEIEIVHNESGDKLTIVTYACTGRTVKLGFRDKPRNFDIMRPEAHWKGRS